METTAPVNIVEGWPMYSTQLACAIVVVTIPVSNPKSRVPIAENKATLNVYQSLAISS